MRRDREALRILLGGMLGMALAMGIGRFAFTPILPLMQRDLGMSNATAGWIAGLNYLGYLAGAIGCSLLPQLLRSRLLTGGALFASIATTLLMGATVSVPGWGVLRLAGGFASAILFIVISAEVADALTRRGHFHWTGALYGGVGFGIALSGSFVPVLDAFGQWRAAWGGMGLLAVLLAFVGIVLGRRQDMIQAVPAEAAAKDGVMRAVWPLATSYFFEGLGYVVTATFLVAIIAATPALAPFAPYSWVAVGVAAIPSTILWPQLARRCGARTALLLAYGLQAAGILASIWAENFWLVLFAAVSFGATFLGIVALTMAEGTRRVPRERRRAAAILTAAFGIGQVLGPPLAGAMADLRQGFSLPLLLATLSIIIGGTFLAVDRYFTPTPVKEKPPCPTSTSESPAKAPPTNRKPG